MGFEDPAREGNKDVDFESEPVAKKTPKNKC